MTTKIHEIVPHARPTRGVGQRWVSKENFPVDRPVSFVVPCQTDPTGYRRHPIVLFPDWTADTGLSMETEGIEAASGLRSEACSDLVERVIPAIRDTWANRARRARCGVRFDESSQRWVPVNRALTCEFATRTWLSVGEATAHLRDLRHWAHMHKAIPETVRQVWDAIGAVIGGWPDTDRVPDEMRQLVPEADDALMLWRAGIHPEWVAHLNEHIPVTEKLLATTYVHALVGDVDVDWLAGFAPYGVRTVDWAARSWPGQEAANQPHAPHEWLDSGFSYWSITTLIANSYNRDEVLKLASVMDGTPDDAAEYVTAWVSAKCKPSIDQLVAVWTVPRALRVAPSGSMLAELRHRLDPWPVQLSRTDQALIIAACGSLGHAAELLRNEKVSSAQEVITRLHVERCLN